MKKNKLIFVSVLFSFVSSLILFSCAEPKDVPNGVIGSSGTVSVRNVNGDVWLDTNGNPIQTHDNIIYYQGKYYWYGLDYSKNLINGGNGGFKAVKCYESEDLVNWKFSNNVLVSSQNILLNNCDINTVRVLYNDKTKKFVMWMGYNVNSHNDTSLSYWTLRTYHNKLFANNALVATCDSPNDAFEIENSIFGIDGGAAVATTFKDDDGTAYVLDWANYDNSWRLYIHKLSDDYLKIETTEARLFPETYCGKTSMIHHNGYYYLITAAFEGNLDDDADGWLNYHFTYFDFYRGESLSKPKSYTGVRYAFSKSISGPWSDLNSLGPDYTPYEFSDVLTVQGSEETSYILMFNKWNTANLSQSGYVWQKLDFEPYNLMFDVPYFKNYKSIFIDAGKGKIFASETEVTE